MKQQYDALALFSGGLDSILACKILQDQGLSVLGLHFTSPFFSKAHLIPFWKEHYGVDVVDVDVSPAYVKMLLDPPNGYGSQINPCVDCKVLLLAEAKRLMPQYGAKFLVTGEVVGQRPMSQRRDALNLIRKSADVKDVLLRPLSALSLQPTPMEESGLVDREKLLGITGRGRKDQLRLAREVYGFTEIPTPAGGCPLTEPESAGRYFALITHHPQPSPNDFRMANVSRQFWSGLGTETPYWYTVGRNQDCNEDIKGVQKESDYFFMLRDFPGPLGLGRPLPGVEWTDEVIADAAAFMASYAGKAVRAGGPVGVRVRHERKERVVEVEPNRNTPLKWSEPGNEGLKEWKAEKHHERLVRGQNSSK